MSNDCVARTNDLHYQDSLLKELRKDPHKNLSKKRSSKIDDGFYWQLADGACFEGYMGIPCLMDLQNTEIPSRLIPFDRVLGEIKSGRTDGYVHFYIYDYKFEKIITNTDYWIEPLSQFDGVITPDCSMLTGQSNCLQAASTFHNRAVGYYLQKHHIPVIPQVRWSDRSSFDYCFLGVPKKNIIAVSTYGTIQGKHNKSDFKIGLEEALLRLDPVDVVVYGPMPNDVFGDYLASTRFHQYDNWIKTRHDKRA